jgi:hypothetical protein
MNIYVAHLNIHVDQLLSVMSRQMLIMHTYVELSRFIRK